MKELRLYIICFTLLFLCVIYVNKCSKSEIKTITKYNKIIDTLIIRDTIKLVTYHKPIKIIDTVKVDKFTIVKDTIIETKPFIVEIDTNLQRQGIDSINVKFHYPQRIFEIAVQKTADTTFYYNQKVIRNIEKEKEFYETWGFGALTGFVGLVVGILITR